MKSGWVTKKLGEVCEVQLGKMLDKAKNKGKPYPYLANLSVRWRSFDLSNLRTMPFMDSEIEKFSLRPGDVLMCEGGEPGRCAIWQILDSDIKFQKAVHRIRSRGNVEPAYLVAYFESIVDTPGFQSRLTGATIKHLPRERLLEIPIPIPPLAEQKRIVAKIDAAFEKIDKLKANAEKNLANAKELFQSALDEAMRPKKGWVEKRLGEVYNFIDYRGKTPTKIDKGIPLVTARNIRMGYLDYSVRDYISLGEYKTRQSRGIAHKGDILFTTEAPLGFVALADLDEFSTGQRVITFQQYEGSSLQLSNEFYYYYLQSKRFQDEIRKQATGATAQGIKASRLKNIPIVVVPFTEQKQIASRLNSLSETSKLLEQNYARQVADCAEMRQAILREAFEGRM